MPTVAQLMSDPEFHQFSPDERKQLLGEADPEYLTLSPQEQDQVLGTVQPGDIHDSADNPLAMSAPRLSRRFIGDEPMWAKEAEEFIKGGAENLGDRALGQLKGAGQGLSNLGKLVGLDVGGPQMNESRPAEMSGAGESRAMLPAMAGGGLGAIPAGALGGAAETGTPSGTAIGAATGGALAGAGWLGGKAISAATSAFPNAMPFAKGAIMNSPLLGPMLKGGIRGVQARTPAKSISDLKTIAAEIKAAAEAKALAAEARAHAGNTGFTPGSAAAEIPSGMAASGPPPMPTVRPGAPATGSGLTPGPAGDAPPGTGASGLPPLPQKAPAVPSSTTGFNVSPTSTPQVTFKIAPPPVKGAAAAPPAKPKVSKEAVEAAVEKLKAAGSRGERAAAFRELRAAGGTKTDVGEALSTAHRTRTSPDLDIDMDDLSAAQKLVDELGGKRFAKSHLDRLKSAGDVTEAQFNEMKNAIERAKAPRGK